MDATSNGQFGQWLDVTMSNNKIRGRDLARMIGVTDGAVSHWRAGQARPSPATTAEIAKALGVDPVRLIVTAGHADPDTIGVQPYRVPEAIEYRQQAIAAFAAIPRLSARGRARLLETYDEICKEERSDD